MSSLTNAGENIAAEAVLGTGTFFVSLHTGDPGEDGTNNELSTAGGYARQPTTFTITDDTAESDDAIIFGPTVVDKGTIPYFAVWTLVTGGVCRAKGALVASRTWPSGELEADAGVFTLTMA